ncbi:MAG: sigma-54-dependent Fis family transcriptional regulator, partial [Hyphomonadaceae bacterium]|nr:sigma-54-dependent Fis family transcriptional regulator [Hyphomonadaceae bacterium]
DFPQIAGPALLAAVNDARPPEAPAPANDAAPPRPATLSGAEGFMDTEGHIRRFEDIERDLIVQALRRYHGRMTEVARRLGIGRSTLYRKMREFGLEEASFRVG